MITGSQPPPDAQAIIDRAEANKRALAADYVRLGMEKRTEILYSTLYIEHNIKELLFTAIGVKKPKDLRLSFDTQISLLISIGLLESEEEDLRIYKSIRNKFIHQLEITSYVEYFSKCKNDKKHVLKLYRTAIKGMTFVDDDNDEGRLHVGVTVLIKNVRAILQRLESKIKAQVNMQAAKEINTAILQSFRQELTQTSVERLAITLHGNQQTFTRREVFDVLREQTESIQRIFVKMSQLELERYIASQNQKSETPHPDHNGRFRSSRKQVKPL